MDLYSTVVYGAGL